MSKFNIFYLSLFAVLMCVGSIYGLHTAFTTIQSMSFPNFLLLMSLSTFTIWVMITLLRFLLGQVELSFMENFDRLTHRVKTMGGELFYLYEQEFPFKIFINGKQVTALRNLKSVRKWLIAKKSFTTFWGKTLAVPPSKEEKAIIKKMVIVEKTIRFGYTFKINPKKIRPYTLETKTREVHHFLNLNRVKDWIDNYAVEEQHVTS